MQTKDGKYYLFFPAKDYKGIFRIGVAIGENPQGPFTPMDKPIEGSFSIDPAVYKDENGEYYMYFGGLWGGQLQRWRTGVFNLRMLQALPLLFQMMMSLLFYLLLQKCHLIY